MGASSPAGEEGEGFDLRLFPGPSRCFGAAEAGWGGENRRVGAGWDRYPGILEVVESHCCVHKVSTSLAVDHTFR